MQHYQDSIIDKRTGLPVAGATVTVYDAGTSNLSTIYTDNGTILKDNPFSVDDDGEVSFYADNAKYDISISGADDKGNVITGTTEYGVQLFDPFSTITSLPLQTVGSVRYVDQFPGADLAEKLTAAINDLPATGGAVVIPAGTYSLTPALSVAYKDKANLTRKTALSVIGKSNIAIRGEGMPNIVLSGTDAERVFLFVKNCTNVSVGGLGFNLANSGLSTSGSTYLPNEDFIPIALEGNDGVRISGNKFVAYHTAILADALNGSENQRITVSDNTFQDGVNYAVITRNASGVKVSGNTCQGTGRTWSTDTEDVAISDDTANYDVRGNTFLSPRGVQSRITAAKNVGPGTIAGNIKVGGGIFIESYEASNVSVTGNSDANAVDTAEHILFTSDANTNNEHWSIVGNVFSGGGYCISDFNAGSNTKDGLNFSNNDCYQTKGPVVGSARSGVVFKGNRFNLIDSGQMIQLNGQGAIFAGNHVKNGYLSNPGLGDKWIVTDNYFLGNFSVPIALLFDFSGSIGNTITNNYYEVGSYTNLINQSPANPVGFKRLDAGLSQNPASAMPTKITGVVGDVIQSDFTNTANAPAGWYCITAGTPGTWQPITAIDPTVPPAWGATTPAAGAFTTLSAGSAKTTLDANGLVTKYNNVATIGGGIPAQVATIDLVTQSAAISATTIITPTTDIVYRVSWMATITRAGSVSSTLGGSTGFQLKFTDPDDSVVKTIVAPVINSAANTTGTAISGTLLARCKGATALQYLFGYTDGGGTVMQYSLNCRIEAL